MDCLTIVGGVYRETVMWPQSDEVFGSAGRAACSISKWGCQVKLFAFADEVASETMSARSSELGFDWHCSPIDVGYSFYYTHGLATPSIRRASGISEPLHIEASCVLRYGTLEPSAVVTAERAVYDPQNAYKPEFFSANGSKAKHLAVVLNEHEAATLLGRKLDAESAAHAIAALEDAEVVVLKRGPRGALVLHKGSVQLIPAYDTQSVSKIGSGDQFAAHFAHGWMIAGLSPIEATYRASRATAFYCGSGQFPTEPELRDFKPAPLVLGPKWLDGYQSNLYLAGPFFTLSQMWMVQEARQHLSDMRLDVFSPYHDIGVGFADDVVPRDLKAISECDLMFAIVDGLDAGTVYEVGYARSLGKPVVVFCENETAEDLKMMQGSDCFISNDFVSAVYRAAWIAAGL